MNKSIDSSTHQDLAQIKPIRIALIGAIFGFGERIAISLWNAFIKIIKTQKIDSSRRRHGRRTTQIATQKITIQLASLGLGFGFGTWMPDIHKINYSRNQPVIGQIEVAPSASIMNVSIDRNNTMNKSWCNYIDITTPSEITPAAAQSSLPVLARNVQPITMIHHHDMQSSSSKKLESISRKNDYKRELKEYVKHPVDETEKSIAGADYPGDVEGLSKEPIKVSINDDPVLPSTIRATQSCRTLRGCYKLCITYDGTVDHAETLIGIDGADEYILSTLRRWRYRPQPVQTCLNYCPEFKPTSSTCKFQQDTDIINSKNRSIPMETPDECFEAMSEKWATAPANSSYIASANRHEDHEPVLEIELSETGRVRRIAFLKRSIPEVDNLVLGFMRFDPRCRFLPARDSQGKPIAAVYKKVVIHVSHKH
jgi:hypothetical protein